MANNKKKPSKPKAGSKFQNKEYTEAKVSGKTILLKKPQPHKKLTEQELKDLIHLYLYEGMSTTELGHKYRLTKKAVEHLVANHRKYLNDRMETYKLIKEQKPEAHHYRVAPSKSIPPKLINEKFVEALSSDTDPVLSEAEYIFAWIFAHTGNSNRAIKEASLDVGLTSQKTSSVYSNSVKLRALYLRQKPNVLAYIKELKKDRLQDLKIDKVYVQSELVQQIEELKDVGTNKTNLIRAIELLGKSIGAFTDKIQVEEVSPGDALDQLIDMAKEDIEHSDEDGTLLVEKPEVFSMEQ